MTSRINFFKLRTELFLLLWLDVLDVADVWEVWRLFLEIPLKVQHFLGQGVVGGN
jgi:hypothetical protein